jgi:SAM-dependent methyltransferase
MINIRGIGYKIAEWVLRKLSRPVDAGDYPAAQVPCSTAGALDVLEREFPGIGKAVSCARVVDYGCGWGYQSVALYQQYQSRVLGIDPYVPSFKKAEKLRASLGIDEKSVKFQLDISPDDHGTYDVVISQNSFEHFADPVQELVRMTKLLRNGGRIYLTFGPLWFSPAGSHMHFFCRVPWLNIFFPERVVIKVRNSYRNGGGGEEEKPKKYEDVGLNRMTLAKFERIIRGSGLEIIYCKYTCVKKLNFLAGIPILREFFVNCVSVIIKPKEL